MGKSILAIGRLNEGGPPTVKWLVDFPSAFVDKISGMVLFLWHLKPEIPALIHLQKLKLATVV